MEDENLMRIGRLQGEIIASRDMREDGEQRLTWSSIESSTTNLMTLTGLF